MLFLFLDTFEMPSHYQFFHPSNALIRYSIMEKRKEEETIINKSSSKTATGAGWLGWLDYY
jgi:hypothetical protein